MSIESKANQSNLNVEAEKKSNTNANHVVNILNSSGDNNTSSRSHTSQSSTLSGDSDLSLSLDRELEAYTNVIDVDELPAFEVRLISPMGRTPSPIDSEEIVIYPDLPHTTERLISSLCTNNPEYIALHDINAQLSPPKEASATVNLSRTSSLETIFEGVFLNTPPRQHYSLHRPRIRSGSSMIEKYVRNRCMYNGKENQLPFRRRNTMNTTSASHME